MADLAVPSWCRLRTGRRPILLVAPHGGRANDTMPRASETKVNDVHTAEFTWRLAEALDTAAIINPQLDRNELDLNRITQVTRDAPWFPQLIERLLASLLETHPTVEVLFIHGWNVIQPKCDIGVGATFAYAADALDLPQLTVHPDYLSTRLHALHLECAAIGVHTSYGERYPASHRNNVLQLFRRDGSRACAVAPRICEWAAANRLNAVQLELGVPLRWPGRLRDAFAQALIASSDAAAGQRACTSSAATFSSAPASSEPIAPTMLLAYDSTARIGFMSGMSPQPDGQLGGRLLLFSHGQTMSLFTGQDPTQRAAIIGGPAFATDDDRTLLRFAGYLLEVGDAAAYVRLEHAFLQSRLIEAHADLAFIPTHDDFHGHLRGSIAIDGHTHRIDTPGFRNLPIFLRRTAKAARRCSVAVAFGAGLSLHAATVDDDTMACTVSRPAGILVQSETMRLTEEESNASGAPARLHFAGTTSLDVRPVNHMQIHRPLPHGGGEMIYLGLAQCTLSSGESAYGFYEFVRPEPAKD